MDTTGPRAPRFDEDQLRDAIAASRSWSEVLRRLDYRSCGGNWKTLKKYAERWQICIDHFNSDAARRLRSQRRPKPLKSVMVENSTYHRGHLKRRLLSEGLKDPSCELCGQGELWFGRRMALILDHVNGVPNDHRLDNLRMLCPNCAATLETHCGRKNRTPSLPRPCARCGQEFAPGHYEQRYCSRICGSRWDRSVLRGIARPEQRKVERPTYAQLKSEIEAFGYRAAGRKYGVSDNAVRKWVRWFESEAGSPEGSRLDPSPAGPNP